MASPPTSTGRRYAEGTNVSLEKSQADIKKELLKRGATAIMFHDDYKRRFRVLGFQLENAAQFLVFVPMPDENAISPRFPSGKLRPATNLASQQENELARLHRSLFILVKAKLVAIDDKITTLEREFFADRVIVADDGRQITVYEWYAPQIEHLRKENLSPPLLPGVAEPKLLLESLKEK